MHLQNISSLDNNLIDTDMNSYSDTNTNTNSYNNSKNSNSDSNTNSNMNTNMYTKWSSYHEEIKSILHLSNINPINYEQHHHDKHTLYSLYPNDIFNSITCNEVMEGWIHLLPSNLVLSPPPYYGPVYHQTLDFIRTVFFPTVPMKIDGKSGTFYKPDVKWLLDSSFLSFNLKFKLINESFEWDKTNEYEYYRPVYEVKWSFSTIIVINNNNIVNNMYMHRVLNSILLLNVINKYIKPGKRTCKKRQFAFCYSRIKLFLIQ